MKIGECRIIGLKRNAINFKLWLAYNAGHLRQFGYLLLVSPVMMLKSTKDLNVNKM